MHYDRIAIVVEGYRLKQIIRSFVCLHSLGYPVVTFVTQRSKIVLVQCDVNIVNVICC